MSRSAAARKDAEARRGTRPRRQLPCRGGRGGERRRLRHPLPSGRCLGCRHQGDRRRAEGRRDHIRCRLGQRLGRRPDGAASSKGGSFRAGASRRRHGIFRAGCGFRRTLREPLVHPDAAAGHRPRRGRAARRVLAAARRQCRDDDARASRPRARDHQPRAASDRLQHRRHRSRPRDRDGVRR